MEIRGGAQPEASTFIGGPRNGYVRFVQIRDFDTDGHLTYIKDSNKWRKCCKSDILIARYGASLGRILRGIEGAYNVALVKAEPTAVESAFLYYLLRSHFFQEPIIQSGARSAQAGFNKRDLSVIPVPVPPASEQCAISGILSALDDKVELNRKMSATLEAMARALFKSRFVDFDPVHAKAEGRDHGLPPEIAALFPDSFEDSELGEIPKGWGIERVGSIANASRSTINPAAYPDEPLFHYSIPAFDDGRLPIKQTGSEVQSNKFLVPRDSVLLSRLNPRTPRVWMPQVDGMLRSICSTEFAVMIPHMVSREWLYGLFSNSEFCVRFAAMVTGTSGSHQRVKPDSLAAMPVVSPPKSIAGRFTDFASPVLLRAWHRLSESQTLATLRDALLPKLISGEIRVTDAERLVEQSG